MNGGMRPAAPRMGISPTCPARGRPALLDHEAPMTRALPSARSWTLNAVPAATFVDGAEKRTGFLFETSRGLDRSGY
jgi:hypothetical protein